MRSTAGNRSHGGWAAVLRLEPAENSSSLRPPDEFALVWEDPRKAPATPKIIPLSREQFAVGLSVAGVRWSDGKLQVEGLRGYSSETPPKISCKATEAMFSSPPMSLEEFQGTARAAQNAFAEKNKGARDPMDEFMKMGGIPPMFGMGFPPRQFFGGRPRSEAEPLWIQPLQDGTTAFFTPGKPDIRILSAADTLTYRQACEKSREGGFLDLEGNTVKVKGITVAPGQFAAAVLGGELKQDRDLAAGIAHEGHQFSFQRGEGKLLTGVEMTAEDALKLGQEVTKSDIFQPRNGTHMIPVPLTDGQVGMVLLAKRAHQPSFVCVALSERAEYEKAAADGTGGKDDFFFEVSRERKFLYADAASESYFKYAENRDVAGCNIFPLRAVTALPVQEETLRVPTDWCLASDATIAAEKVK